MSRSELQISSGEVSGIVYTLMFLWIFSLAGSLCYTMLTWSQPFCCYNYFNNPFLEHKCDKCTDEMGRCLYKKDVA